jgi:hypothetical protein
MIKVKTMEERILIEVNGKKYYRYPNSVYYDMYIKDKNKYFPLMGQNYKLTFDEGIQHNFDDIYTYYWDPYWCWVKDEYIELSDEEFCLCPDFFTSSDKKDKHIRCKICTKIIPMFGS